MLELVLRWDKVWDSGLLCSIAPSGLTHCVPLAVVDGFGERGCGRALAQVAGEEDAPPLQLEGGVVHLVGVSHVEEEPAGREGAQRQLKGEAAEKGDTGGGLSHGSMTPAELRCV